MSTFGLEQSPTIGFTEGLLPVFWNIPPIKFTLWNAERRHEIVLETCPAASLSAKQFCIRNGRFHHFLIIEFKIIAAVVNDINFFAINHNVAIAAGRINSRRIGLNRHIPNDFAKLPTLCRQLTLKQSHVLKGSN
jgi:hypothetical protein